MSGTPNASPSGAALPFLPGYRVELAPKDRYHKSHIFDLSNGIRVDMHKDTSDSRGGQTRNSRSSSSSMMQKRAKSREQTSGKLTCNARPSVRM